MRNIGLIFCASLLAVQPLCGKTPVLLVPQDLGALVLEGNRKELGTLEVVTVTGQSFDQALRVATRERPAFPWDVRLRVAITEPIQKGDTLWLGFSARRIESLQETGEALVGVVVELSTEPHPKLLERELSVGPEWTMIQIPFDADQSAAEGELQLTLRLGYKPQMIELGGLELLNYGADVSPKSLPNTKSSYSGSEPDHPWRQAAADRIERLRKGDLTVLVTDTKGQPIADALVEVRMQKHAFAFGTAIQTNRIAGVDSLDNERYRQTIAENFNKVVFENDLKWPSWVQQQSSNHVTREQILATLDWCDAKGIPARGHVMVWPSWQYLPSFLREMEHDPDQLQSTILAHIADQAEVLGERLAEWDVVNESYAHHDLLDILGRGAMIEWFQAAKQGAPNVRLFYNDYTMFSGEGPESPSQHFEDTIQFLLEEGAPLGGIGEQGHFGGSPPSPLQVLETFDRFARFGLPIQISEFDIDTSDTELQVAYTRDFLTAAFSHPAVTGVICWGFWEGRHWKPRAAFWDTRWKLRPNGQAWVELVKGQWWTNADLLTDVSGLVKIRGFCGEYELTLKAVGHKAVTQRVSLSNLGEVVEMKIP